MPQDSNSNTLLEKIIGTAFPSKIGFNKNISKGKAMLSCILDFLPCVLNKSQLGIIAREIEGKVEDKSISQEYANKLCAIIGKYIDKNYGNEAKKVREYVAHARHLDPQSLSHDVDHDEGYCSS
ncbi:MULTISPECIES: hypothetical protein [Candidatus Cardinium]|uniref:hypothetical protein n=1 Tax=Candidatus Cardinium TaxID=273135 RepID=UPI001FAA1E10|nr:MULTISPECIES: hypothetical protein [Cardinium]